jgi:hypothetical protein
MDSLNFTPGSLSGKEFDELTLEWCVRELFWALGREEIGR